MQDVADQSVAPTTIAADLWAIFISLELSRSTWLATSLSPGRGEKMSKHIVSAGDIAALLGGFRSSGGRRARGPANPARLSPFKKRGWTASGFTVSC
jgi:hypothetical protein